jgi:hypothetical protein
MVLASLILPAVALASLILPAVALAALLVPAWAPPLFYCSRGFRPL